MIERNGWTQVGPKRYQHVSGALVYGTLSARYAPVWRGTDSGHFDLLTKAGQPRAFQTICAAMRAVEKAEARRCA